jgi:hypothetical protein
MMGDPILPFLQRPGEYTAGQKKAPPIDGA